MYRHFLFSLEHPRLPGLSLSEYLYIILYNKSELQSEVLNRMKGLLAAHLISLSNREFQILVVIWNLLLQRVPRVS